MLRFLSPIWNVWSSFLPFFFTTSPSDDLAAINDDLLVQPALRITPFDPLVGRYTRLVHVDLKESNPAVITPIAAVPAEARSAGVAHPQLGLVAFVRRGLGKRAIVVDMVARS